MRGLGWVRAARLRPMACETTRLGSKARPNSFPGRLLRLRLWRQIIGDSLMQRSGEPLESPGRLLALNWTIDTFISLNNLLRCCLGISGVILGVFAAGDFVRTKLLSGQDRTPEQLTHNF